MVRKSGFGQIVEEGDSPGFFKILRREDLSSEIIRMIPHDFIRSISNKPTSFKMVLKVAWGSSWPVKISKKNPSFVYMEDDGWNKFVNDNALGENEYLTFTHEANMRFNVSIYEPDGKEMLTPRESATIASSYCVNKSMKREDIVSSSESSHPSLKKAESAGSRLKMKRELNLGKKKAKEAEKSKKSKKKKKVDSVCNDTEAGTSSLVPEFSLTIKKSHLLFLGVPKKFVDMHMPRETKMFKIYPEGKEESWEVLYLVTDVQSRFSAGWARLTREIGLAVGDVCTLKLIKPTEMLLKVSRDDDDFEDDDEDDGADFEEDDTDESEV